MKTILSSLVFLSFFSFSLAQSDEINISASFAQSIELRVIGNSAINFTFSTINDYQRGKWNGRSDTGFEVASSTSFEVQAEFTPLTSAAGDQIDMRNLQYHISIPGDRLAERGVRWDIPTPDYNLHQSTLVGFFTGDGGAKTIVVPGPAGNAGDFEDNRFYLQIALTHSVHQRMIGLTSLLDQNIQPGTYTCTMTLTAIPQAL